MISASDDDRVCAAKVLYRLAQQTSGQQVFKTKRLQSIDQNDIQIAMNLAIDFTRKRKRQGTTSFDEAIASRDGDGGISGNGVIVGAGGIGGVGVRRRRRTGQSELRRRPRGGGGPAVILE